MSKQSIRALIFYVALFHFVGCSDDHEHGAHEKPETPAITNRINLSSDIISNLGITFSKVSSGKLGSWISVPGKLEVPREKRYVLSAPASGRIFWKIDRLSYVERGTPLATIESSALSEAQQALAAAKQALSIAKQRKGGDQGTKLRLEQAERKFRESLGNMSVLTGLTSEELLDTEKNGKARWINLSKLELLAPGEGFLFEKQASDGELLKDGEEVGHVLNVKELVFRGLVAANLYSDIPQNAAVRIEVGNNKVVESKISGPTPIGDMDIAKVWVEASVPNEDKQFAHGLPAVANVQIKESEFEEAIVPENCVMFDDLQAVLFKRDAAKPDFVIRTPIEIGNRSAGRFEVFSGVIEGDEIVCNGIHQIKALGAGKAPEGGHFHADGTWHDGEE